MVIFSPCTEKDVNRTDRTNRFYEGIDNPGLALLHDILMTYCMYDFDLGESRHQTLPHLMFFTPQTLKWEFWLVVVCFRRVLFIHILKETSE